MINLEVASLLGVWWCVWEIVHHKIMEVVGIKEVFDCLIITWGICIKKEEDLVAGCFIRRDQVSQVVKDLLAWVGVLNASCSQFLPLMIASPYNVLLQ